MSSRKTSSSVRRPSREPLGEHAVRGAPGGDGGDRRRGPSADVPALDHVAPGGRLARDDALRQRRPQRGEVEAGRRGELQDVWRPRGELRRACPAATTRPWSTTTTWSASRSASSMRWVVRTTATPASRSVADQVPDGEAGLRVEPGGRLVEEDELRPADHGEGQREPLALAAGQPADGRAAGRLEAEPPEPARPGRAGRACSAATCREHLAGPGARRAVRRPAA